MLGPLLESYRLLGLAPGAGVRAVRRAFMDKVRAHRAEAVGESGSVEEFIRLRRAYKMALGHEEGRKNDRRPGGRASQGDQGKDAPPLTPEPTGGGLDVRLSLRLSPEEAAGGLKTVIRYRRFTTCESCRAGCVVCRGLGWLMIQGPKGLTRRPCAACLGQETAPTCPTCGGRGGVEIDAEAYLQVPAGVEAGWLLVLPGLGHKDRHTAGDLILKIEIGPETEID